MQHRGLVSSIEVLVSSIEGVGTQVWRWIRALAQHRGLVISIEVLVSSIEV